MRAAPKRRFAAQIELDQNQTQSYRELVYLYALERRKAECDAQFRAIARLMTFDYVLAFAWVQNDFEIWNPNEAIPVLVEPSSPRTPPTAFAAGAGDQLPNGQAV